MNLKKNDLSLEERKIILENMDKTDFNFFGKDFINKVVKLSNKRTIKEASIIAFEKLTEKNPAAKRKNE